MKDTFRINDTDEHTFQFHRSGYGGSSYVAAYVKNSRLPVLSKKYQDIWDSLLDEHEEESQDIYDGAYEDTQRAWWEWAQDRATELSLGTIHSTGRCGGWLILDIQEADLEELASNLHPACGNCDEYLEDHGPERKCLFGASQYTVAKHDMPHRSVAIDQFKIIIEYIDEVEKNAAEAHHELGYQLEFLIEQYIELKKEEAVDEKKVQNSRKNTRRRASKKTSQAVT